MIPKFTPSQYNVHYPADRKFVIQFSKRAVLVVFGIVFFTFGIAWIQYLIFGLPADPSLKLINDKTAPLGFPLWLIFCHWMNFFLLTILLRSGLSILFDHPRLYWRADSKPGSEWLKFTNKKVSENEYWTAKDDARYLNPVIGLPGYRHSVGIARSWHFIYVPLFIITGIFFISMLFLTDYWRRVVPSSFQVIPDAWKIFVHYATFNLPVELNGYYQYNALQKLSYFGVIFFIAPISILTGLCMAPSVANRFPWFPKIFGGRQGARSVHFLAMLLFLFFIIIHVSLVCITGFKKNINHITINSDSESDILGVLIFFIIILFVVGFSFFAHFISWRKPRILQKISAAINGNVRRITINKLKPQKFFTKSDISSYFWTNGKIPQSATWKELASNDFKDYKLEISGLVKNEIEFSLAELKKLGKEQNITMHHCIQGWTGVAEWGGVALKKIIDIVEPLESADTVVFYSFGEGLYGGKYYDTHTLENCLKPQSILAWEMNYKPLPVEYGAPLRLRIENQLGYKMVKWIQKIEFVSSHKVVGKGFGGKNEDDEYYDLIANI